MTYLARQKDMVEVQERNHIHREMRNFPWLRTIHHCLNGINVSQEEFRDNLDLRYGPMPQDIPLTCDSCGKKFLIKNYL